MQKTILTVASLLSFLIAPAPAFALFSVNQGGTGQAFFTAGSLIYGNGTSALATTTPGTLGYVLQFNGTFPTWVATSSLGLVANPAGSDGQVQINDGGAFGVVSGFSYDKVHSRFVVPQDMNAGNGGALWFGNPNDGVVTSVGGNGGGRGGELILQGEASSSVILIDAVGSYSAYLAINLLKNDRHFGFPDVDGTFGLLQADQSWTGTNTFSKGASATTTVNIGELGDVTSHACFNTKNTDGQDVSFFIVGTSIVVEANACQ